MSIDQLSSAEQGELVARKMLDVALTDQLKSNKLYVSWSENRARIEELEETDDDAGSSSPTDTIISAVEGLSRERKTFVQTADFLAHVQAQGLKVGGQRVIANLSSKIFQSRKFKSYKNHGWVLNEFYEEALKALPANTNTAEGTANAA